MSCCGLVQAFPCRMAIEEVVLEFDFGPGLDQYPGALIETIRPIEVATLAGVDGLPSEVLMGPPGLSPDGRLVLVPIGGGIPGVTYQFFATVVLSNGLPLVLSGYSATV